MTTTKFDTSKEALESLGIELTDEQYDDLVTINLFLRTEGNPIPVHHILLVLKTLGLLPIKTNKDIGNDKLGRYGNIL